MNKNILDKVSQKTLSLSPISFFLIKKIFFQ